VVVGELHGALLAEGGESSSGSAGPADQDLHHLLLARDRRVEEVAIEEVLEEEAVGILRKSSKKDCRFARSGRAKRA